MAILNQNSQSQTFFAGWYGTCEAECQNLNISTSSFRDKIYKIYQIRADNLTYDGFDGVVPANLDSAIQVFTEFECGKLYIIILKSGTGQVDLPHFKEVNNGSIDAGRVTQNCAPDDPDETYSLSIVNESLQDSTTAYPHNENESLTFKLTTTGLNEGDTVAWEISGSNITLDDFVGLSSLTGNFTLDVNGESLLPIQLNEDSSTESSETFRLSLVNQTSVYIDVPVDDTSQTPLPSETYELIESNQYGNLVNETPNEFNNLVIKLKTSGVSAGTVVPFTINGSAITLEDFVGLSSLQGTFTVGDDGSDGNFLLSRLDLQIAADSTTEGPETFRIALDNHQAVFLDITIQDTSQTSAQLVLSATHTELDEGVYVNNIPYTELSLGTTDGSLLNPGDIHKIRLTGSGITPDDFKWSYWSDEYTYFEFDSSMEVDFVVDSNGYTDGIMLTTKADSTTEGPETVRVILVDDPNVFIDIDINDTSQKQLVLTANFPAPPIDEGTHTKILLNWTEQNLTPGDSYDFVITGSNITPDDFEYWLDPSGVQQQFDSSLQGTLVVNSNGNAFTEIKASIDSFSEGLETFTVSLVSDSNVFVDVDINEISNYEIVLQQAAIYDSADEDGNYPLKHFYLRTKDGSNLSNTNYGFKIEGVGGSNIDSSDFDGYRTYDPDENLFDIDITPFNASLDNGYFTPSGTYSYTSGVIYNAADQVTEGPETYRISLIDYPDAYLDIQINDTSVSDIPGTLQIQPHFNNAGAGDSATEVEPSSAGDPDYDDHYFIVKIPDWTGGSQLLNWEITSTPSNYHSGIEPEDIQVNSRQSSGSAGEVTVSSDGMSGTWQVSDYDGMGIAYQEFTPIYVLHDDLDESGWSQNVFTFKVTDENGNSSTVIGRIEDPS